jgi:hypothetical protein
LVFGHGLFEPEFELVAFEPVGICHKLVERFPHFFDRFRRGDEAQDFRAAS